MTKQRAMDVEAHAILPVYRKNEGCSKREFTMIVMYTTDNNCARVDVRI